MGSVGGVVSVCVFCSSSEAVPAEHRRTAAELGAAIAGAGWRLVYGGGGLGLMGEVARAALGAGGEVVGVIPERLLAAELAMPEVSELVTTATVRERKAGMDERADAFCVLPGGIGTLEELVEVVTLKQLGYHGRPVVVVDAGGFWAPLLAQLDRMVDLGLARPTLPRLFTVVHTVPEAMAALRPDGAGALRPDGAGPPEEAAAAPARGESALEAFEAPRRGTERAEATGRRSRTLRP